MVSELGLKASTLNEFVTVRLVVLVSVPLLEKDVLDVMIPLIIGTLNPDPFCLVYGWDDHGSSHFAANTHYDDKQKMLSQGKDGGENAGGYAHCCLLVAFPSFLLFFPDVSANPSLQAYPEYTTVWLPSEHASITVLRILIHRKRRA